MPDKMTEFLLELYDEMVKANEYMPEDSPSDYAFCIPYCTLLNKLKDLGVSDKRLGIRRTK